MRCEQGRNRTPVMNLCNLCASVAKEKLRLNLAGIQRYNQIENGRAGFPSRSHTRNVQRRMPKGNYTREMQRQLGSTL